MRKQKSKLILTVLLALILSFTAMFGGLGCAGKKSAMTQNDIEQHLSVSRILLPMVGSPVCLKVEVEKDGKINTTEIKLAIETVDFTPENSDKSVSSMGVQAEVLNNGERLLLLRLFADGLYLDSSVCNLHIPFDFKGLLEKAGLGGTTVPDGDDGFLDDFFFADPPADSGENGGEEEKDEGFLSTLSNLIYSNSEGIQTKSGKKVVLHLGNVLSKVYLALSVNKDFKSLAPLILKIFNIDNIMLMPVIDLAFNYDKEGDFLSFETEFVPRIGIKVNAGINYIEDYKVDTSVDFAEYLDITTVMTSEDLSRFLNFLLSDVLVWLQNGNLRFSFETDVYLVKELDADGDIVTLDNPKHYKVKGNAFIKGEPLPLDKIMNDVTEYLASRDTEESEISPQADGGIDIAGILKSFTAEDINAIIGIIKKDFESYKLDIEIGLDMALYDPEIQTPVRQIKGLTLSIAAGGFEIKNNDTIILEDGWTSISDFRTITELFEGFFLESDKSHLIEPNLYALNISFITRSAEETEQVVGIKVSVNEKINFIVTDMVSVPPETTGGEVTE